MANISIDELSLTIAELIDLDPDQKSTIESAVTRAISVKDIVGGQAAVIAGKIMPPPVVVIGIVTPPNNLC
jgi:hypothetical protein